MYLFLAPILERVLSVTTVCLAADFPYVFVSHTNSRKSPFRLRRLVSQQIFHMILFLTPILERVLFSYNGLSRSRFSICICFSRQFWKESFSVTTACLASDFSYVFVSHANSEKSLFQVRRTQTIAKSGKSLCRLCAQYEPSIVKDIQ
jgi:hypothetical protein